MIDQYLSQLTNEQWSNYLYHVFYSDLNKENQVINDYVYLFIKDTKLDYYQEHDQCIFLTTFVSTDYNFQRYANILKQLSIRINDNNQLVWFKLPSVESLFYINHHISIDIKKFDYIFCRFICNCNNIPTLCSNHSIIMNFIGGEDYLPRLKNKSLLREFQLKVEDYLSKTDMKQITMINVQLYLSIVSLTRLINITIIKKLITLSLRYNEFKNDVEYLKKLSSFGIKSIRLNKRIEYLEAAHSLYLIKERMI